MMYRIRIHHGRSQTVWLRYADTPAEAETSALAAAEREWPDEPIRITQVLPVPAKFRGDIRRSAKHARRIL